MTLQQLRYFVSVAKSGSFRRAAKRVFVSQPTLSQQIKLLENELGVRLLHRNRSTTELTEIGTRILYFAEQILAYEEAISRESRLHAHRSKLNVTSIHGAVSLLLPQVFADFQEACPEVSLTVREAGSLEVAQALSTDRADFGIIADYGMAHAGSFERQSLLTCDLVVCEPTGESAPQDDSGPRCFISLPQGFSLHEVMRNYMSHFEGGKMLVYTTSAGAALQLVSEGIGTSILPRYVVNNPAVRQESRIKITPCQGDGPTAWNWVLIWNRSRLLSPTDRMFISELVAASKNLAATDPRLAAVSN